MKSDEHITNMNAWNDMKMRLSKDKTIDKHAQEHKPIDILNYIKKIDFFPNTYITYRLSLIHI